MDSTSRLQDLFAFERFTYFLESHHRAVLRGKDTLARDYPIPYEETLREALVDAFSGTYFPALEYLIESGLLDEIMLASYNPETGTFSTQMLTSAFRPYFGSLWASSIQQDIEDAVEEMWDLGEEYITEELDEEPEPSLLPDKKEDVLDQLILIGALACTLGAVDQVITPTTLAAAREAYERGYGLSEFQELAKQMLRLDTPGRSSVYYDVMSTSMVNRARNIGRLHRSWALGKTVVYWVTAGDERVCGRCSALEGTEFAVDDLMGIVDRYIDAPTTQDAINAMPWPSEQEGEFELPDGNRLSMDSAADILAESGIGIPPLHPRCRCDLEVVRYSE